MKVEEAAAILGISADADMELLKQTFRKLALVWHPDKCNDAKAKEKFQQISIAYTKLITSRSKVDENDDYGDNVEDDTRAYDDNVHEIRAFMRIFMDLVGIFNDEQGVPDDGKLPGVSFGMMLGNQNDNNEEWSTEDDDGDMDDDDDDDDYDSDPGEDGVPPWEPMVKHYFHMNLKDEIRRDRIGDDKESDELEAKRKQRNAKKRAEKRRKQKEKKMREAQVKAEEMERLRQAEAASQREQEEAARKRKEELRLSQEAEALRRKEVFRFVSEGKFAEVKALIEDPSSGVRATERYSGGGKAGAGLLHYCVSKADDGCVTGRLEIARYLLSLRSPSIDQALIDDDGRTMLHCAAIHNDFNLIQFMVDYRNDPEKKVHQPLDINARCLNNGWTPLHYAAVNGKINAVKALINAGALLNVHAYSVVNAPSSSKEGDKGLTPLELVKHHITLETTNSSLKSDLEEVRNELIAAIDKLESSRIQRDLDKSQKEQKLKAEKLRLAQKEQTEKELLERKQKQLKEKQDRERERQKEEEELQKQAVSAPPVSVVVEEKDGKGKKKKKNKKKNKAGEEEDDDVDESPSVSVPASVAASGLEPKATSSAKEKDSIKAVSATPSSPQETAATKQSVSQSPSLDIVAEIRSRDELLDHLLAMGFSEQDCMAAITACGLNVDMAISWLCDDRRQTKPAGNAPTAPAPPASTQPHPSIPSDSKKMSSSSAAAAELEAQAKAQKEKDLKEELRRINRAWNAKVPYQRQEEERKKAEAEKLAKEQQKQKMLQQQMQQQYSMHNSFNANMSMMGPSQAMGGHQSWGISSDTPPLHGQSPLGLPQPAQLDLGGHNMHSSYTAEMSQANYNQMNEISGGMDYNHRMLMNNNTMYSQSMSEIQSNNVSNGIHNIGMMSNNAINMSSQIPLRVQSNMMAIPNIDAYPNTQTPVQNSNVAPSVSAIRNNRVMQPPPGLNGLNGTDIQQSMYNLPVNNMMTMQGMQNQLPIPQQMKMGMVNTGNPAMPGTSLSMFDSQIPQSRGRSDGMLMYDPPPDSFLDRGMSMSPMKSPQYMDGAVHLSAVARPFIPKFSSPGSASEPAAPLISPLLSQQNVNNNNHPSEQHISWNTNISNSSFSAPSLPNSSASSWLSNGNSLGHLGSNSLGIFSSSQSNHETDLDLNMSIPSMLGLDDIVDGDGNDLLLRSDRNASGDAALSDLGGSLFGMLGSGTGQSNMLYQNMSTSSFLSGLGDSLNLGGAFGDGSSFDTSGNINMMDYTFGQNPSKKSSFLPDNFHTDR